MTNQQAQTISQVTGMTVAQVLAQEQHMIALVKRDRKLAKLASVQKAMAALEAADLSKEF